MKKPTFEDNKQLVWHVIYRYFGGGRDSNNTGYTKDDLFQLGCIGLLKAVKKYNPEKYTVKFSTYAVPTIWGEIVKDLRETGYDLRVPRRVREVNNKIKNREVKPTIPEIMEEFNVDDATAIMALDLINVQFLSMDKPLPGKSESDGDIYMSSIIPSEYNLEENAILNIELEKRLSVLNDKERKIIEMTRREYTQREIGEALGISQVQVSRILKKAIDKAKNYQEVVAV